MLQQGINDDLKNAVKAGDAFKVGVLRMLNSALHNKEIEKKGKGLSSELSDKETIEVLSREAKKRKESADIYLRGGREDLANKEKQEWEIIIRYLPEQLGNEEIEKIVAEIIAGLETKDAKAFGRIMGEAMEQLKGRADAGVAGAIVKKLLEMRDEK